jgi:hypothetical protein
MPGSNNIYRVRALLILLVFSISLLPRQVVHNFVTSHKHVRHTGVPGEAQLSAETFNCTAGSLFVQQTYDGPAAIGKPECPQTFLTQQLSFLLSIVSNGTTYVSLRGPPSIA